MSTSPDTMLLDLQKHLSEMLDPLDIPRSWTDRQLNDYESKRARLAGRISVIQQQAPLLASLDAEIAQQAEWRAQISKWRDVVVHELRQLGIVRTPEQQGLQQNLRYSLAVLDSGNGFLDETGYSLETLRLGALMRSDGFAEALPRNGERFGRLPWFGALRETELRINELTERRDTAKRRLDEALMSDAEREQKAKDDLARVAAENAKPQRKTRGDGSQYDKYPDGRIVEVQPTGSGVSLPVTFSGGVGRVTPVT
jgi:hypothetical protein